jgi:SAM-dependent methyltransferase
LDLSPNSHVLDVGCGPGRLPIGILDRIGEVKKYRGVDVDELSVRWSQRHITGKHPNFQFIYLDVKNTRYNNDGADIRADFRFPFDDEEFDIIHLYSVFSHMLTEDVRAYLRDFQRILKPSGGIFLTAFVEDSVPNVSENPKGYRMAWENPLHCVRYNKDFFEQLLAESHFVTKKFSYATESDGQSAFYISKSNA